MALSLRTVQEILSTETITCSERESLRLGPVCGAAMADLLLME